MQETQVQLLGNGKSPEKGNGKPLQYSCLGNPMDRRAWQATVHEVAKSCTQLLHNNNKEKTKNTWYLLTDFCVV